MIEKRAVCRTNPGTADTRRHIVFLRVLEQSGALFLCPECRPAKSRSGPAGASAEAAIPPYRTCVIYAHNVRQTMRLQAKSQRYGRIRSRSGIRGEGDGVCAGGEEGEGRKQGERQGAQRCAPVEILYVLRSVLRYGAAVRIGATVGAICE